LAITLTRSSSAQYEEHWLLASAGRAVLQNLFVYILEHPNREEAKKNWAAFQADPEWKKVKPIQRQPPGTAGETNG
jgi:hypothetical protein